VFGYIELERVHLSKLIYPKEIPMKLNTLLLVMALAEIIFGLGFLLVPALMMDVFGATGTPMLFFITRMFGAAIVSLGLIFWMSRNWSDTVALKAIISAGLVYNFLATVLVGMAVSSGLINPSAWGTVILHAALTAGFAYFSFVKQV
jgi:hypothetical protein